jgi:hypothetical protein
MPIQVACSCGKKFAAKDELAGKRVKCPTCGGAIAIPAPAAQAPPVSAPQQPADPLFGSDPFGADPLGGGAASGGGFDLGNLSGFDSAPAAGPLGPLPGGPTGANTPPAAKPAGGGSYGAMGAQPHAAGKAAPASGGMDFGMKLALFGGGGVILLVGGAFCVYAAISSLSGQPVQTPVATNAASAPSVTPAAPGPSATPSQPAAQPASQAPASSGAAATPGAAPPAFPPSFPPTAAGTTTNVGGSAAPSTAPPAFPPAFPPTSPGSAPPGAATSGSPAPGAVASAGPAATPASSGSKESRPLGGSGVPLPGSVLAWHGKNGAPLLGAKAVKGEEMYVYQYSWMCDVLPFLGYEKLYNEFDFKRPWTDGQNLTRTRFIIPQFINPSDGRVGWKGYPFQGSALTHFAGISGIEDQRNVVAAELPRSDPRAGVFGYHEVARPRDIADGTSNTIMIIGSGELAGLWVQGGGATIRGAREPYFDKLTGFGSRGTSQPGAMAMFADGSVRHVPATIDSKVFRAMCTIHGGETVDLAPLGASAADFPAKQ